jgi:membrane protein DedA with SNARE-associated domain
VISLSAAAAIVVGAFVGPFVGWWIGERLALWLVLRRFRRALRPQSDQPKSNAVTLPEQPKSYAVVSK